MRREHRHRDLDERVLRLHGRQVAGGHLRVVEDVGDRRLPEMRAELLGPRLVVDVGQRRVVAHVLGDDRAQQVGRGDDGHGYAVVVRHD
ncbi:MAG: hypothetical protein ACLGIA_13970, partial [Actinomycetes bacterium]